jgi:ProP effector
MKPERVRTSGAPDSGQLVTIVSKKFPSAFDVKHSRPLKLGIDADLLAAGEFSREQISAALAVYVGRHRYLRAIVAGAVRIDLHGRPAGTVTAKEAAHASQKLAKRIQRKIQNPAPMVKSLTSTKAQGTPRGPTSEMPAEKHLCPPLL